MCTPVYTPMLTVTRCLHTGLTVLARKRYNHNLPFLCKTPISEPLATQTVGIGPLHAPWFLLVAQFWTRVNAQILAQRPCRRTAMRRTKS